LNLQIQSSSLMLFIAARGAPMWLNMMTLQLGGNPDSRKPSNHPSAQNNTKQKRIAKQMHQLTSVSVESQTPCAP
jgi:hypothetical protein